LETFYKSPDQPGNTYIQLICKPRGYDHFDGTRPFVPVNALYKGIFREKFEKWYTYNVALGELPPKEIVKNAKTIIIPGSGAGAWENQAWILNLKQFIKETYDEFKNVKFLGICFGM